MATCEPRKALAPLAILALSSLAAMAAAASMAAPGVDMLPLPERGIIAPAIDCATLTNQNFSGVAEGPARIQSAAVEAASAERAEFCFVKGYVAPSIQFELRLPTKTWSGRYLQGGCGGNCGMIPTSVIDLSGDRAVVVREGRGDVSPFASTATV